MSPSSISILLGAQWGDEGKGKVLDFLIGHHKIAWLDLVLLRYSAMINGFTSLAVTKVDILDQFHEIKIAIGYELNGRQIEYPPATVDDWANLRVHYKTFEGWQSPTTSARQWEQLPEKCHAYLEFIQNQLGVPVEYIGVGKGREQLIVRTNSGGW
ncbi:hypothetical protein niasHT_037539 [Heterodera trifolii]|uniref:Adenylosuccinate synthetase n=1 Tax=Heterodera trifolii TaxID=157864 RepID=A0ABD2IU95_9BILA